MITQKQLTTLQTYANSLDTNVKLSFEEGTGRVLIHYGDTKYIGLANKVSSLLTVKMVKSKIEKCVEANQ